MITSMAIVCGMFTVSLEVQASEKKGEKIDGSYLTNEEYAEGRSSNNSTRGIHMMDGECSITKAGRDEIYCYGATTANHEVDKLTVVVYVDRYHEAENGEEAYWGQIDWWVTDSYNDYFVHTDKTLEVDRGYYYRVHADHFVAEGDDPVEETFTVTDGIYLPK